jgi:hypothetical protein
LTAVFYPNLADYAEIQPEGEISFPLSIYGPDAAGLYRLRRKIVKGDAYKNWRLNGELVHDPEGEPNRFDELRPGDLAVFGFQGRIAPETVTMILLAQASVEDAGLVANLASLVPGRRSMASVKPIRLAEALVAVGSSEDHPLHLLARDSEMEAALEDAAMGGAGGPIVLGRRRRRGRPVTSEELARAKELAERTGREGEALVDHYLDGLVNSRGTWEYEWTSTLNAVAPYDFRCQSSGGAMGDREFKVDVKTTRGDWTNNFHLSMGEVNEAAESPIEYFIYRVSDLDEGGGGTLQVSKDIRAFAASVSDAHDRAMPDGVRADSFSVPVDTLDWSDPIRIEPPDEADEV